MISYKTGAIGDHYFINNCLGSFYRGTLDWFGDEFYPLFQYKVIGTYAKCVEFFNKKKELDREVDTNLLPSITLNPDYEIRPDEVQGKLLWQSQNIAPGLAIRLFDRLEGFEDQSLSITPVFSRYVGGLELIFWLESVYQLHDFRIRMLQFCGGLNRIIRPRFFESFITIPDEFVNYNLDGTQIDWSNTNAYNHLIDNIAQQKLVYPVLLSPWFKLESLSDTSEKYGGDSLASYKLSANMVFEIDLPTYMIISDYTHNIKVECDIWMDGTYSRYGSDPSQNETRHQFESTDGNPTPMYRIVGDADHHLAIDKNTKRAIYTFTSDDVSNNKDVYTIPNPFDSTSMNDIIISSYNGILTKGEEWQLSDDYSTITFRILAREGELVEFFKYN